MSNQCFAIDTFCENGKGGNTHLVIFTLSDIEVKHYKSLSCRYENYIFVIAQINTDRSQESQRTFPALKDVMFFYRGFQIHRCGSGSLALVYALSKKSSLACHDVRLANGISVGSSGRGLYYYESDFFEPRRSSSSRWRRLLNVKVDEVYLLGGKNDYVLIVVPQHSLLCACRPDFAKINISTKRALIVTSSSDDKRFDYAMRYFAPQYGNPEDQATGSANAMLAIFWQKKLNKKLIRGHQRSAKGAYFRVEHIGARQRVYGCARETDTPENFAD